MKKGFTKIAVSAVLGLAVMLPALANTTTITMTATVADVVTIQIVDDNNIVASQDEAETESTIGQLTLNFGTIDARGAVIGTLGVSNTNLTGTLNFDRFVVDSTDKVHEVTNPPSMVKGALYYVEGLNILTNRSGGNPEVDVKVANTSNAGEGLSAFVEKTTPAPTDVAGISLLAVGAEDASFHTSTANNTPQPFTFGLYVDNTTAPEAYTTELTFTADPVL